MHSDPLVFRKLQEVRELKFSDLGGSAERILIVANLPYNPQFESKILEQVNKIKLMFLDIRIYRKDVMGKEAQRILAEQYKAKVKDQTIFLVKNPYEQGITNIDFEIFMQYPSLIETYLQDVRLHDETSIGELKQVLVGMSPHESILIYLFDS